MSRIHFQRVRDLFIVAVELEDAARVQFLNESCSSDEDLRRDVESMLAYDAADPDAFDASGIAIGQHLASAALEDAAAPPDVETRNLPSQIGQYTPLRIIGEGGMGIVYEAEQQAPQRRVALKMIRRGSVNRKMLQRLRFEAEVLGRLQHPGIAQIYEAGTYDDGDGGQPFFAMELVDGLPLTTYAREHNLGTRDRLTLFLQVCEAVQHAHQKSVVHRDLKPDNVLVDRRGHVRVLDFGVARAIDSDVQITTIKTDAGALIGTVPYMSPEQVTGRIESVDTRSDIYALGVLLFELLTERLPHDLKGRSIVEAARIIAEDDPLRLSSVATTLRGDLDIIIGKALEKSTARRYQTAAEFGADIQCYLASKPISARPPSRSYLVRRFTRRHRTLVAGALTTFLALLIGLIATARFSLDARAQAAAAEWANYCSQMRVAGAALSAGDVIAAQDAMATAPAHLGGWEYAYMTARLSPALVRCDLTDGEQWVSPQWSSTAGPLAILVTPERHAVIGVSDHRTYLEYSIGENSVPTLSGNGERVATVNLSTGVSTVRDVDGAGAWSFDADPRVPNAPVSLTSPLHLNHDGTRLAFSCRSPKGPYLAVTDVETGTVQIEFTAPRGNQALAINDAGTRLAIGNARGVRLFDIESGTELASADVIAEPSFMSFSRDGASLAIGSTLRQSLVVCDAHSLHVTLKIPRLDTLPHGLAFSHDSQQLAISRALAVDLWDLKTGSFVGSIASAGAGTRTDLVFDVTGTRLLTVGSDSARLVDRAAVNLPRLSDTDFLYLAAFSPDGSVLATAGFSDRVQLWDVLDQTYLGSLDKIGGRIRVLSFSEDGQSLFTSTVSSHLGNRRQFWTTTTAATDGPALSPPRSRQPVTAHVRSGGNMMTMDAGVAFAWTRDGSLSVDGNWASVDGGRNTAIVEASTGAIVVQLAEISRAVAISNDHRWFATSDEGAVVIRDTETGAVVHDCATSSGELIYALTFDRAGQRLVGAGRTGLIHFWDVATGRLVCSFREHTDYVHHVTFSDDGTRLASVSGDGTARLFDRVTSLDRESERNAAHLRRAEKQPLVERWRREGVDESIIAERLDADDTLTVADRRRLFAGLG